MVLNTIRFHHSNNSVKVNNQIFYINNIIAIYFWLVTQESDLGHCFHSKCQITAKFAFIDINTDDYYKALNVSNGQYLNFNDHLKYHKIKYLSKLTINNKISKTPILHYRSAISHTCGSDAITFVRSMSKLEVTLTMCHNLGLFRLSFPKIGGLPFLSFDKF